MQGCIALQAGLSRCVASLSESELVSTNYTIIVFSYIFLTSSGSTDRLLGTLSKRRFTLVCTTVRFIVFPRETRIVKTINIIYSPGPVLNQTIDL